MEHFADGAGQDLVTRGCWELRASPKFLLCFALKGAQRRAEPHCTLEEITSGWQEGEVGALGWAGGGLQTHHSVPIAVH